MKTVEQSSVIYETGRIRLRGLCKSDINGNYFHWFNDQRVCEHNSHGLFPSTCKGMEDFIDSLVNTNSILVWAIEEKKTGSHIGNISLQEIDWLNRCAEYAIIIGEKSFCKQGLAAEASEILLQHGFSKLNLNRVYCGTASTNTGMQKLAIKLGMKQEGVRRRALFLNGIYVDLIEYGILSDDFTITD